MLQLLEKTLGSADIRHKSQQLPTKNKERQPHHDPTDFAEQHPHDRGKQSCLQQKM
jgi:hypothetical protein